MGRRRPVWQAALLGAAVATLPDLDVLLDGGDEFRSVIMHRAETHALFWQALAAPLIAFLLGAITRSRELYLRWLAMVLLVLFTHSGLDAMTVYGTRIGLPFTDRPFGLGSLFIIDPLYTLPLLAGVAIALALRRDSARRWSAAGLALSAAYAGWSIAAQANVTKHVLAAPEAGGLGPQRVLVTPTPFNTLVWRIVLLHDDYYDEGFYSLLDPWADPGRRVQFARFSRGAEIDARTQEFDDANVIREFTRGYYALADNGNQVTITNLLAGQYPHYAYTFAFAEYQTDMLDAVRPTRYEQNMPVGQGLTWLWGRARGMDLPPPR
jgi:inner membrane protein